MLFYHVFLLIRKGQDVKLTRIDFLCDRNKILTHGLNRG